MPDKSGRDDAAGNDGSEDQTDKSAPNDGKPRKPSNDEPQDEKGNEIIMYQ